MQGGWGASPGREAAARHGDSFGYLSLSEGHGEGAGVLPRGHRAQRCRHPRRGGAGGGAPPSPRSPVRRRGEAGGGEPGGCVPPSHLLGAVPSPHTSPAATATVTTPGAQPRRHRLPPAPRGAAPLHTPPPPPAAATAATRKGAQAPRGTALKSLTVLLRRCGHVQYSAWQYQLSTKTPLPTPLTPQPARRSSQDHVPSWSDMHAYL